MGHTSCHGDAPSVIPGDSQEKGQLGELTGSTAPVERWLNVRNHPNVLLQRRASRQEGRRAPLLTVRPPLGVVYTGHGKPHHEHITSFKSGGIFASKCTKGQRRSPGDHWACRLSGNCCLLYAKGYLGF